MSSSFLLLRSIVSNKYVYRYNNVRNLIGHIIYNRGTIIIGIIRRYYCKDEMVLNIITTWERNYSQSLLSSICIHQHPLNSSRLKCIKFSMILIRSVYRGWCCYEWPRFNLSCTRYYIDCLNNTLLYLSPSWIVLH